MANYVSSYTGAQIDNVIGNALLKAEAQSTYLTQTNANNNFLKITDAATTYLPLTGGNLTGNLTTSAFINTNGAYGMQKWAAISSLSGSTEKTITLTTHGRPVFVIVTGDNNPTSSTAWLYIQIYRDTTRLTYQICESHGDSWNIPFGVCYLDAVAAGTYTYKCSITMGSGTSNLGEDGDHQAPQFIAFEI